MRGRGPQGRGPNEAPAPAGGDDLVDRLRADNQRLRDLASAAARLAEFGRFAAEQNHELRQPLLAIKGLAQLLLDKERLDAAEVHDSARHIVEQADRMVRLISELKHLAAPRRAGGDRSDLGATLARVAALLDYRIRRRAVLDLDVAPDAPPVAAAADQVEQILINLLANAVDAVGGTPAGRIQIRIRPAGAAAEICVADNGSGISPAARRQLFEAFFTTKGPEAGTGLGLALSREIARGLGGELDLLDAPGEWPHPPVTVFRLTLPAAATRAP